MSGQVAEVLVPGHIANKYLAFIEDVSYLIFQSGNSRIGEAICCPTAQSLASQVEQFCNGSFLITA